MNLKSRLICLILTCHLEPICSQEDSPQRKIGDAAELKFVKPDPTHSLPTRVDRISSVPTLPQSGMLPMEYFNMLPDESTNELDLALSRKSAYVYSPVIVTDEDLLKRPTLEPGPYAVRPSEVNIYCYPFGIEEVTTKCGPSLKNYDATGLYLPMMAEIGSEREAEYYEAIVQLKKSTGALIYGVAYDNPNWSLIVQIVKHYPKLFDGVLLEWIGSQACIWNIHEPSEGQVRIIEKEAGHIYYFYRNQECEDELVLQSPFGSAFVNPNMEQERDSKLVFKGVVKGEFPSFITPIFACFQGHEGYCYKALRNFREKACSARQKFVFSPFEPVGNLIMHYTNETCQGLPSYDLYSVV